MFDGAFVFAMNTFQTLQRSVEIVGVGIHSGAPIRAILRPSQQCGIVFVRRDLPDSPEIWAAPSQISDTTHATTLRCGEASLSTPEHLMAALWMSGITHCRIEIDGPEIPILDGSARDWCALLDNAGIKEIEAQSDESALSSTRKTRPIFGLRTPLLFQSRAESGDVSVFALPHDALRVSVFADFGRGYLASQLFDGEISTEFFRREIAAARTFALEEWVEPLRARGLIQGGTPENALILGRNAPLSPLRFSEELARHKALDLLGDIALLLAPSGGILRAHFIAMRAGHTAHHGWMKRCLEEKSLIRLPDEAEA